jgi:fucose permease
MIETMRQPKAWLSALLFFVYVGAEVSLGTWTYSLLVESRGIAPELAGLVTGSFWAMFTVGRLIAGLYAKRAGVDLIVQSAVIASIVGAVLLLLNPSEFVSLLAVALIGFSIAPVFAALTSGTSKRVSDQHAANTIGMQMAFSGLGGATIPGLIGILARRFSLELIPVCLIIVFAILFGLYRLSMLHHKATTVWNSQEDLIT